MTIEHGNDADYRLPATAVPTRYSLRVDPDIGRRCFEGEVAVELTVTAETTELVLNAAELEVGDRFLFSEEVFELHHPVPVPEAIEVPGLPVADSHRAPVPG